MKISPQQRPVGGICRGDGTNALEAGAWRFLDIALRSVGGLDRFRDGITFVGLVVGLSLAGYRGAFITSATAAVVPTTDDLWDLRQGIHILQSSGVRPGFDVGDLFGGNISTAENGAAVFPDPIKPGDVHFVEWETPSAVTVRGVALFAVGDGVTFANQREVQRFRLMTETAGSEDFDLVLLDFQPTHPYEVFDPARVALLATNLPAVTGKVFRTEFTGWDGGSGEKGPRIVELDAYGTTLPALGIFPPGGAITNLTEVRIGVTDPNLTVRYTLDGSGPTEALPAYRGLLLVGRSMVIKALAFDEENQASELARAEFLASAACVIPNAD
jgi:hypothetical protein